MADAQPEGEAPNGAQVVIAKSVKIERRDEPTRVAMKKRQWRRPHPKQNQGHK